MKRIKYPYREWDGDQMKLEWREGGWSFYSHRLRAGLRAGVNQNKRVVRHKILECRLPSDGM